MNKFGHSLASKRKSSFKIIRAESSLPFTSEGQYDMEHHRLCNVKTPQVENDASNKVYVDTKDEKLESTINQLKKDLDNMNNQVVTTIHYQNNEVFRELETKLDQLETKIIKSMNELIVSSTTPITNQIKVMETKLNGLDTQEKIIDKQINVLQKNLEDKIGQFIVTPSFISVKNRRIVKAGKGLDDTDLVTKGQLNQEINKIKDIISKKI